MRKMSVLIDENTRILVQGVTGHHGSFHAKSMLEYGAKVVAGTTPGKGGTTVHGIPVYNTVEESMREQNPNTSIIFVPAPFAKDAALEAINAGIKLIVIITEHVPILDTLEIINYASEKKATIIGPNTPGIISPGKSKVGIMPGNIFKPGKIGMVSRSGTLTYEIASIITNGGLGQSTCVGIGGDAVIGTSFTEILSLFEKDSQTEGVVLVGEIGGDEEERAAKFIRGKISKPVIAFVAGRCAPSGKRMGHAGAIISGAAGTPESKIKAFERAGVPVAKIPVEILQLVKAKLKR